MSENTLYILVRGFGKACEQTLILGKEWKNRDFFFHPFPKQRVCSQASFGKA